MLEKFPDRRPDILAVDGGASKVDAVLVMRSGELVGAARIRAYANFGLDHQPPLAALEGAIRKANFHGRRQKSQGPVAGVGVFCLAGADLPLDDRRIARQLKGAGWTSTVVVRNDTFAVLRAGSMRGWGVAVVCGSGLNCAAVSPDGRVVRFPSLGELSGDVAHGGGWLGRAALGAALRGRDGRGPRTELERLVPDHFRLARPASVMEALYVGRIDSQRMLDLAPLVFRAAARGDAVSRELIDQVSDEVVATANAAIRRLHLATLSFEVILGGGVFQSGDGRMFARIRQGITSLAPRAEMRRLDAPPVLGAALLGLDQLGSGAAAGARLRDELTERRMKSAKH